MLYLVINPGSTSTKLSLYRDDELVFEESVFHDAPELLKFPNVNDQVPMRTEWVLKTVEKYGFQPSDIDVFIGRGGSAYPQHAGVLEIDQLLYEHTRDGVGGSEHAAKLGVMMAWELGNKYGGRMYTLNPTNIDELCDLARVTGIDGVYRSAQSHALNQKGVAALYAAELGRRYEDCNFIVAHIDGGITVHAHKAGKMIDGNVGAGGDGPFTPTRIGSVPVLPLLDYIDAQGGTEGVRLMCSRAGGFVSHFGTSNADTVHKLVDENDPKAVLIWNAMIYQICKDIGAMSCVLEGRVDGIILTGGLCRFGDVIEGIKSRCGWIAPIRVYPGEVEQQALHDAVARVMKGEDKAGKYTGEPVWKGFDHEQDRQ